MRTGSKRRRARRGDLETHLRRGSCRGIRGQRPVTRHACGPNWYRLVRLRWPGPSDRPPYQPKRGGPPWLNDRARCSSATRRIVEAPPCPALTSLLHDTFPALHRCARLVVPAWHVHLNALPLDVLAARQYSTSVRPSETTSCSSYGLPTASKLVRCSFLCTGWAKRRQAATAALRSRPVVRSRCWSGDWLLYTAPRAPAKSR